MSKMKRLRLHLKGKIPPVRFLILRVLALWLILLSAYVSPPISASDHAVIEAITFKSTTETEDQVTFKIEGFLPPQVFGLESENPRVVCDFPNTRLKNSVNRLLEPNGRFIKRIRVGIYAPPSPKVRVVLDLVPEQRFDIQQVFSEKDTEYSVIVSPVSMMPEKPKR